MNLQCIWTGDTTTHGGVLLDGIPNFTYNNRNKAVCVGHKFWCPKCFCWSQFVEGFHGFTIDGKARVLHGYRASCGAKAIHQVGIQDWCEDERSPSTKKTIHDDIKEARGNQSANGKFHHNFIIRHENIEPLNYIVFSETKLLDVGIASAKGEWNKSTTSKIRTDSSEKIMMAIKAPQLKI